MSAPTPAPGDDRPREGYYPDPSIPGYVRYWNGAAWVPGTSRPAPSGGEPLAPPPAGTPASAPAAGPASAPVEETGPHFFDEDPAGTPASEPGRSQHGSRPEPASAWGADRSRQTGFGGDPDRRVSWGGAPDPRTQAPGPAEGATAATDGSAAVPPAEPEQQPGNNTFVFRRPTPGPAAQGAPGSAAPATSGPTADEGTMTFRALSPRTSGQDGASGAQQGRTAGPSGGPASAGAAGAGVPGPAAGTASPAGFGPPGQGPVAQPPGASPGASPAASPGVSSAAQQGPGFAAGRTAAERAAAVQAQQPRAAAPAAPSGPQAAPSVPQQSGPPAASQAPAQAPAPVAGAAPMAGGAGGGQPSWAQQVHRLAGASGEDQPVAPWKPPVDDVFQAAARRQAAARPASLGKRFAARLLDTVVLLGVTGAAAVPLGTRAIDHVDAKIDTAKASGETVTVWLLDGTTSVYLGIVLAVLLVFGALYEALPTAKWGRTLGKRLFGLEVRDIEAHEPPTFGGALRRWLVYSVPGLLVVGVVGVLWCLFDKPWRQCWHDKAAHTFVTG
ncbi:RDD family protein [Streptomyces sp. NPDC000983]|uniref:RDD family protein n=1 Tax=Streptomyces sp. NPDC000983 TaxID=3154373 RepID=UPI00331B36C1